MLKDESDGHKVTTTDLWFVVKEGAIVTPTLPDVELFVS